MKKVYILYFSGDIMKDSLGNELTKEQEIFFKDSKIRDEKGNLLVLHHGSPIKNIKVFKEDDDYGNFFTTNLNYAKEYAKDQESEVIGTIYDVYLNIKNPLNINSEEAKEIYKDKAKTLTQAADIVYNYIRQNRQLGYDGIIALEELSNDNRKRYGEDANISYIPLDANQIKSITNKIPTNSKDINERLNDMFTEIKTKQVYDSDGFLTDYTMYKDNAGNYIFIFGDRDVYNPYNTDTDWEIEASDKAEKLADEWFENYEGFEENDVDDDLYEASQHGSKLELKKGDLIRDRGTDSVLRVLEVRDDKIVTMDLKSGHVSSSSPRYFDPVRFYVQDKNEIITSPISKKSMESYQIARNVYIEMNRFFNTEDYKDGVHFSNEDRKKLTDAYKVLGNYLELYGY